MTPIINTLQSVCKMQGRIHILRKGVTLYVGLDGWPTKKILGFWWSKKAEITLETISFWQNISINIFRFSQFLYAMKACQWNLINFSQFSNALIRKEKKNLCSSQWEKKLRKTKSLFLTGCFMKSFNMITNPFFVSQAHSQPNFCFFWISGWRKTYQKGK